MGMLYKRGNIWWIKYYRGGRPMRESSGSEKEGAAKSLLRQREGDIERGLPVSPRTNRVTFDELAADVLTDYRVNNKKSLEDAERRLELHLEPFFGGRRAISISTATIRDYVVSRQACKAKNATINRELSLIGRAFSLGIESSKIAYKPKIPMLREDNVRTGFFEPEQFQAVRARLTEPLQRLIDFAYITGWRIQSEVMPLQWRQVDFAGGTVRLDQGTTKNGDGRVFPMTHDLRALLEAQRAHTDQMQRDRGMIVPDLFHRDGKPIRSFKRAWKTACKSAGIPARIPHDFRRTAVRNLVRAGIPERVAMMMTGHKTRSVFERYNIVSEGDLTDAAAKLNARNLAGTIRAQSAPETASLDQPTAVSY